MNNLQLDSDYTQVEYQGEEFPPSTTTIAGGTGTPVLTINGVITGPNVTFSGGSSGFSYVAVGTTTLNLVSALTTKGDIYTWSTVGTRLAVGANGTVLTADSAQTTGLRWATAAAGTVTSFSAAPSGIFDVATATTTPALSLDNQAANTFLRGPTSGGAATPSFGVLVDADLLPFSGTYTPTLTGVANVQASTAYLCQYLRVGNTVTVAGRLDVDPTSASTLTQLGISLPIASAFSDANQNQAGGTAVAAAGIQLGSGAIISDVTNDRAELQFNSLTITVNTAIFFTFTYMIV